MILMKHGTVCNNFKDGSLKRVDMGNKVAALKSFWIYRLFNQNFHEPKTVFLKSIQKVFD